VRWLRKFFSRSVAPGDDRVWDQPNPSVLSLHPNVVRTTYKAFAPGRQDRVEFCVFWYGMRINANEAKVSAVVVPEQRNTPGNYRVLPKAMDAVLEATRPRGWVNLAQLHTHPGEWVGHSQYDDEMANSRRALSLVFPRFGRPSRSWIRKIGVHEFIAGEWRRLSVRRVKERLRLNRHCDTPVLLDLRNHDRHEL